MRKIQYTASQEWLNREKWQEWGNKLLFIILRIWIVALVVELLLFVFFQPTEELDRWRYCLYFVIRPSSLQAVVLLLYWRVVNRKRKSYRRRTMCAYAVVMLSVFVGIIVCVHTSARLMPMVLLLSILLTPLYKDFVMTVLQAVFMIVIYMLDTFYFIPHSTYMLPTNNFIETCIFVGAVFATLAMVELVNDVAIVDEERSKRDSLTYLYNHESFYEELQHRQNRFAEKGEHFSVIIADIDNFKKVNDTYGHAFGDQVIEQLADVFREEGGRHAFCARYGGEEFAMILPGEDGEQAYACAERMRKRFGTHEFLTQEGKRCFTISLGIAEYDKPYTSPSAFFDVADQALYRAKENGKNQVMR